MPNALSRKKDYRNNVLRNLATSLVLYEQVKTTKAKAKAVKPVVERLISIAKKNDLSASRAIQSYLFDENATRKMFEVIVPRYKDIASGFIQVYQLGLRNGDSAPMTILKLVPGKVAPVKEESVKEEKSVEKKIKEDKNASKDTKPAKDSKAGRKTSK